MSFKKTSVYWNYFSKLTKENGEKYAVCNLNKENSDELCKTELKLNNTSCLKYHINSMHSSIAATIDNNDSPVKIFKLSIKERLLCSNKERYRADSEKHEELTELILNFIIKTKQSISILENADFLKMLAGFDNRYICPTRQFFTSDLIPRKYQEVKCKIQLKLQNANAICITTDGWQSVANDSYLSVTSHFIEYKVERDSADLIMKNITIGLKHVPESHKSNYLADNLLEIFQKWCIKDKITYIVCDGAANMVHMFEYLKKYERFYCFGHLLNLVVKNNLTKCNEVNETLSRCRQFVGLFKHSSLLTAQLYDSFKLFNNNKGQMVSQDVPTRWNSSFIMMKSILNAQDSLRQVLTKEENHKYTKYLLNSKELDIISDL